MKKFIEKLKKYSIGRKARNLKETQYRIVGDLSSWYDKFDNEENLQDQTLEKKSDKYSKNKRNAHKSNKKN